MMCAERLAREEWESDFARPPGAHEDVYWCAGSIPKRSLRVQHIYVTAAVFGLWLDLLHQPYNATLGARWIANTKPWITHMRTHRFDRVQARDGSVYRVWSQELV
jgi:hypothetical protein